MSAASGASIAVASLVLLAAFGALTAWQIRTSPPRLGQWAVWSVFFTALMAVVFASTGSRVPPVWSLLAGPCAAILLLVRLESYKPGRLPPSRLTPAQALADDFGDRLEKASVAAGVVIVLWTLFWPRPYTWALAAAGLAPWGATLIAIAFRSQVTPVGRPELDSRPTLGVLIVAGWAGLRVAADSDIATSGGGKLVLIVLFATAALLTSWAILSPRAFATPRLSLGAAALAAATAVGSVLALNVAFDRGPITLVDGRLEAKHIAQGRTGGRELIFAVALAPAGSNRVRVSRAVFAAVEPGDRVCFGVRPGALGVAWFDVARCPHIGHLAPNGPPST